MGVLEQRIAALESDGYVILPSVLSAADLDLVRSELAPLLEAAPKGRNDFEGYVSNRVYALLRKAPSVARLVEHPAVIPIIESQLTASFLLSANLAINSLPGETAQSFHPDDGHYQLPRPCAPVGVGVIWAIDAFTADNGATEVIPGSHRWADELPDADDPRRLAVIMPAGSCVVFSGQLWHRGGANLSSGSRLAITPQYCRAWARQQENMILSVGEAARDLSLRVQAMLGYSIHAPFMGHVNGMHPLRVLNPSYDPSEHDDRHRAATALEGRGSR